jgi:excisionase family DNA binding protein
MDQLISVGQAAQRLGGISKWTVYAWLSQGRLQRTKVGGRTMIRESELQKVIEDGGKSPTAKSGDRPEMKLTVLENGQAR